MALAELALAAKLYGSYAQASAERRALDERLAFLQQFYAPELAARQMLMARLGKESPLLAAQHERNVRRTKEKFAGLRAVEEAKAGRTGVERSGAIARLETMEQETLSAGATSYGEKQQALIDDVLEKLLGRGAAGPMISEVMGQKGRISSELLGQIPEALVPYLEGLEPETPTATATTPAMTPSQPPVITPAPTPPLVPPRFPEESPMGGVTPPPIPEELWEEIILMGEGKAVSNVRAPTGGRGRRGQGGTQRWGNGLRPTLLA